MLLFSTVLDISSNMKKSDFWELINEWNRSQYMDENKIPDLNWQGEPDYRCGNDKLWLAVEEYPKESTYAVRYEKHQDNGSIWDTDYVMNMRNMTLTIRLERNYTEEAIRKDQRFSAPYLVELLMDKGYLKKDKDLPLTHTPIYIEDDKIDVLAKVVTGDSPYKYPIVYISKNVKNEDPVNVKRLAQKLRGIAHVLVEKDYSQNEAIRTACQSKQEYNGSIGVYYPGNQIEHKKFIYRRAEGEDSNIFDAVRDSILVYSNSQLVSPLKTWQGVKNAILLDEVAEQRTRLKESEEARAKNEAEVGKLLDEMDERSRSLSEEAIGKVREECEMYNQLADEEIEKLKKKIEELSSENERLRDENQREHARRMNMSRTPLLYMGDEYEFFDDEIKDLVLQTLDEVAKGLPDDSRKKHVFEDIVRNNDYGKICKKNADRIRAVVPSYDGMTPKMKSFFEEIGFEVREGGKHYKMIYYGDQRYIKTMSKTPSDRRSGEKVVHDLLGLLY